MNIPVPCDSCRICRCTGEALTRARALFSWAEDVAVECSDYEPNTYHGIEGVVDVICVDRVFDRYVSRDRYRNRAGVSDRRFEV